MRYVIVHELGADGPYKTLPEAVLGAGTLRDFNGVAGYLILQAPKTEAFGPALGRLMKD